MINKSRDEIAISLIDLHENPPQDLLKKIRNNENVLSVRVC